MGRTAIDASSTVLSGWGLYPRSSCHLVEPETIDELRRSLDSSSTIPRGLGRSYGDPALNEGGQVLGMTRLNRYLDFDAETGVLRCEAGVSLERIIDTFAPRGWFPMITPGTKHVTVGGCIANDVHGKGHHAQGSFAASVLTMRVLCADGSIVTASRTENSDLFWATFGGMGLLGVVVEATVQLRPIETTYYRQQAIIVNDLDEMLDAFDENNSTFPYSVAYVDPTSTGQRLGRGVLTVGDHARLDDLPARLRKRARHVSRGHLATVPFELPSLTLNPLTIRLVNGTIKNVLAYAGAIAHYEKFFYPLDAIGHWNRGYGSRGFTQYQFVVPLEDGRRTMRGILETIVSSGSLPFLNILKRMGKASGGHLSFPFEGYTFAIDFPIREGTRDLTRRLDDMVREAGGRIYLGKDAFLEAASFRAMYQRFEEWLGVKRRWDPKNVFTSDQARRLELLPG
ncbi:MAG: FAD-binding oxidoreductase [Polyangiaceae bacterium]|nr:FAD-binding oxidoreductase [Polyangiaceae bacterium]